MAKVAIKAISEAGFAFTLYHREYCEMVGSCTCKVTRSLREQTLPDGSSGQQYVKIVQPRDVYLDRGQVVDLDARVVSLSQIAAAMRQGRIEVKELTPPATPAADPGVDNTPKNIDRPKANK